jgi:hypothetical protein
MSFDERPPEGWPRQPEPGRRPQPDPSQPQGQYPLHPQQYGARPDLVYPLPLEGKLPDNSTATLSMVLGILGLGSLLAILSPFAWVKGSQALAEIDANPGVYGNRGMAVAGRITGIIGTVLLAVALLFGLVLLIVLVSASS